MAIAFGSTLGNNGSGHDIFEPGVKQAVQELFPDRMFVEFPTSIWSARILTVVR